jgi:hypothetical protein
MKNIYNISLKKIGIAATFAALVFTIPSCKKYTDLQPVDALPDNVVYNTPANIALAAAGVYNAAALGNYSGGGEERGYPFGAAAIEQAEMRGEDMVNVAAFYQITYQATYSATSANNVNMWNGLYTLINRANAFIDGVHTAASSGVITATVANQYEGEARFLRALAHHELVINFCRPYLDGNGANPGVPYRVIAVTSQANIATAIAQDRGTVAQDYTAILADLDYAEANLPATRSANGITRATSAAAIAIKTRVKLHMGDWAGVITEGTKLGTAGSGTYTSPIGGYKLEASPDAPFTNNAGNTESIFSIEQGPQAAPSVNGALASMFGIATNGGRDLVATSPNLYNAPFWVTDDKRRSLLQIEDPTDQQQYYYNYKYRDTKTFSDYAPIIRYAEVLLNVAEAYSRTGSLANALNLLNAVRNRSVPADADYTAGTFTTSLAMTQAILNERRIEFAGEGRRWGDISRLAKDPNFSTGGIPAKVLISQIAGDGSSYNLSTRPMITPAFAAIPYSSFKFLWPLPATELANNPTLAKEQNPGY